MEFRACRFLFLGHASFFELGGATWGGAVDFLAPPPSPVSSTSVGRAAAAVHAEKPGLFSRSPCAFAFASSGAPFRPGSPSCVFFRFFRNTILLRAGRLRTLGRGARRPVNPFGILLTSPVLR